MQCRRPLRPDFTIAAGFFSSRHALRGSCLLPANAPFGLALGPAHSPRSLLAVVTAYSCFARSKWCAQSGLVVRPVLLPPAFMLVWRDSVLSNCSSSTDIRLGASAIRGLFRGSDSQGKTQLCAVDAHPGLKGKMSHLCVRYRAL